MALARKHNFLPATFIRASEITDEWDQIIQFLIGVISGSLSLKTTLNQPAVILKQLRAGQPAVDFKKSGELKVRVDELFKLISEVTDVAPFNVISTTEVPDLMAEFLDGLPVTAFLTLGKKVDQYIPFYFDGIPVVGQKIFTYIVPAGTTMLLNEFVVSSSVRLGLYPGITDDAEAQFSLKKNGVTITSVTILQPTYSVQASPFSTSVAEDDKITVTVDAVSGTEPVRNIQARVKFRQTLV